MKSLERSAVLLGLVMGVGTALACSSATGTSSDVGAEGATGTVGMELELAPGVTMNTVNWAITNRITGFNKSGSVNVQSSNVSGRPPAFSRRFVTAGSFTSRERRQPREHRPSRLDSRRAEAGP